ncbi:hypothetical protein [Hyphococcus sp.]|uniref:hypothetical protein n=1 Tax=Hyphococcus sp. TaxID=2038636 RepID=UPI003CCB796D
MTGDYIIDSVISLAAIGLMVFVAWVMFRTPFKPVTQEEARERLAFDEPDFTPAHWLVDDKGKAVFVEGADGDYALVSRLGLDLVTRRFQGEAVRATEQSGALRIKPLDPGSRAVTVSAPEAAAWARKFV